jgi:hypothetical protein
MKIILDESAPQKLRLLIDSRHVVVTTWFQGWSGFKNGALLAAAEEAGFDLFITGRSRNRLPTKSNRTPNRDPGVKHEQLGVVKEHAVRIATAIESATAGSYTLVEIGHGRG